MEFITLDQLMAKLKEKFDGKDIVIRQRTFGDGSSEEAVMIGNRLVATFKGRLVTIPPLDGVTPRGPKEYYDLEFMDDTLLSVPILPVDVVNANKRIYKRDVMEQAIAKLKDKTLPGFIGYQEHPGSMPTFVAAGFELKENVVTCTVRVLDPRVMELLESDKFATRTSGFGQVSEDGVITEYEMTSLAIIPAEEDAFRPPLVLNEKVEPSDTPSAGRPSRVTG
jgi:hypothetical protein